MSDWRRVISAVAILASMALLAPPAVAQQKKTLPNVDSAGQLGPKPPVGTGACSESAPTCTGSRFAT